MMSKTRLMLLLGSITVLAAACAQPEPAGLAMEEVLTVTENILSAVDANDYAAFTRDFSPEMLAAFPEAEFSELGEFIHATSGNFIACGESSLSNKQGFAVYRILCSYELEEVVVTIVFRVGGTQVEGLFFDSPNIRNSV